MDLHGSKIRHEDSKDVEAYTACYLSTEVGPRAKIAPPDTVDVALEVVAKFWLNTQSAKFAL